ncbi:MAG: VIT family protein [Xanthobacteraceae bacterium]
MPRLKTHDESHLANRIGWLRAAVLGANDGIISTSSLIVGVAAATPDRAAMLVAGVAGLAAGAMSMAAGEYVSVSSQADTEKADLARETRELKEQPEFELNELADIYVARGVEKPVALEVAKQLMAKDALGAHAREELGITEITTAQPVLAAITSAITFAAGAAAPLLLTIFAPLAYIVPVISGGTLFFLAILGALGAHAGGAGLLKGAVRVTFWGAVAMAATALIGRLVGHAV